MITIPFAVPDRTVRSCFSGFLLNENNVNLRELLPALRASRDFVSEECLLDTSLGVELEANCEEV